MIFERLRQIVLRAASAVHKHAWIAIGGLIVGLYVVGWLGMSWANETAILDNYTWYYIVTITTVGYGDYSPQTLEGRIVASVVMIVGIGILGLVIGKMSEMILDLAGRRMRGVASMRKKGHTVIMGYREKQTEKVIRELQCDHCSDIVLCSADQKTNPVAGQFHSVSFVQGELASEDVLERACIADAKSIIIHGSDDNQTFFAAYAVREINQAAHLVCFLSDENHARKIRSLPSDEGAINQVVLPANVYLMAQELQDRESSEIIQQLVSNMKGDNLYRYDVGMDSADMAFKELFLGMKLGHDATLMGIKKSNGRVHVNPPLTTVVERGDALFYAAATRISDDQMIAMQEKSYATW